jgi:hypothetical protein
VEFHVQASYIDDFVSGIVNGASETMDSFLKEYFGGVPVEGRVVTGYAAEEIVHAAPKSKPTSSCSAPTAARYRQDPVRVRGRKSHQNRRSARAIHAA